MPLACVTNILNGWSVHPAALCRLLPPPTPPAHSRSTAFRQSPPSQTLPEHNHHWYLDDVLKITHEDEMELGPRSPAYTVPTAKSPTASSLVQQRQEESSARRSSMSSNRAASNRSMLYVPRRDGCNRTRERERALAASYRHHSRRLTAAVVVDDPGIGAEATLRGGGWMGADNGRL